MEEAERNQAMEQWLRRVPDDPSGLLREKFRYESRKRQQEPERGNDVEW
jgi:Ca-activated chloride channel family protein